VEGGRGLQVKIMETLGEKHPDSLMNMNDLALTYTKQGRWQEAEKLGMQVLETRKRDAWRGPSRLAREHGNLASTYSSQGRWKEAAELQERVLRNREAREDIPTRSRSSTTSRRRTRTRADGRRQRSYWCRW